MAGLTTGLAEAMSPTLNPAKILTTNAMVGPATGRAVAICLTLSRVQKLTIDGQYSKQSKLV